jgi:hypothetical protein
MALIHKTPPTETLKVCTVKLTPATERTLRRLSQDASDALGWTVSNSAMIRALLSYVEQRPPAWTPAALYPFVEQEIARGRVWGRKKQQG